MLYTKMLYPNVQQNDSLVANAGDRLVKILAKLSDPEIILFGDFLDDDECEALIKLADPRMNRSMTIDDSESPNKSVGRIHPSRTSNGMFFLRGENSIVERVESRISTLLKWPVDHGEGLQILQYKSGAEYKPHYDYFNPSLPGTPDILKRGGQRVATFIMYLSEPQEGGFTIFPDINLKVAPVRGSAVFFSYPNPDPSSHTLHGGSPVISGEKWIATKWLREGRFT